MIFPKKLMKREKEEDKKNYNILRVV